MVVGSCLVVAPLLAVLPAAGVASDPASAGAEAALATSVTPEVEEVPVPDVSQPEEPRLAAKSTPQPVEGFGMVGATWLGKPPTGLRLAVRTQTRGSWSSWTELHGGSCPCAACTAARVAAQATGFGGHGPNTGSSEAQQARVGTDALGVGEVDTVQLRATSASGKAPRGLELSVIDPGTSVYDDDPDAVPSAGAGAGATGGSAVPAQPAVFGSTTKVAPQVRDKAPGVRAPRPRIRSRAAWGADRSMRSGTPQYGRVEAGFVHHTVNTNDYSRSDVPAIIRGIYAYHTQSLGWSDIGYNFLVDRFGRAWTGRFGGKRRAVIGAQVYGYNHVSTGVAAIGNFETDRPTREMRRAIGRVLGWKLGLHGIRVGGRFRWLEDNRFRAVSGHRDGGQTLCPGKYLYHRLPDVRAIAIRRQDR
ncbi:MAG: peptidoglycan recognition protein [Actinomycetota bacterium]|nr:peptidoglycan recognition protein [Actinomycetota bacterium]